jgi:putative transposase
VCGAGLHARSQERVNSRNGYRDRPLDTRVGRIDLQIPKLRKGSSFPSFLEPRRTAEKALIGAIQEVYLQGISTQLSPQLENRQQKPSATNAVI